MKKSNENRTKEKGVLIRGVTYEKDEKGTNDKLTSGVSYEYIPGIYYDEDTCQRQEVESNHLPVVVKGGIGNQVIEDGMVNTLNFDLKLNKRIVKILDVEEGERWYYSYEISVAVMTMEGNVQFFEDTVSSEKVKDILWLKKATHCLATIPSDKYQKEEFLAKVQRCIEDTNAPTEYVYSRCGWRKVKGLGWKFVYAGGIVGTDETLIHTVGHKYTLDVDKTKLGSVENFKEAMSAMYICRKRVVSASLLLFTHAALLETLFEEAQFPINFVYGVSGVTNSRKTSMVLAIAKIFDTDRKVADAEFATATACGIEKMLGVYKDGVVIIDDFKPGTSRTQQKMLDEKLDQLVRFYGNRVKKVRMLDFDSNAEGKYFPVSGGCVLTMEILTGIQSTLSRMFVTDISVKDVDNDVLGFFQKNRTVLPTHFYDFLSWVTNNFEQVVSYINNTMPIYRKEKKFKVDRHGEMFATFKVIADIIGAYAKTRQFWNEIQSDDFCRTIEQLIDNELLQMGEKMDKRDKATLVMEALIEALKEYRIMPQKMTPESCQCQEACYEDDYIIYIRSKQLLQATYEYCKRYHLQFGIVNEDEIIGLLERAQVLDIKETGGKRERSRKLPEPKGNNLRYLYLKKDKLFSYDFD